MSTTEREYQEWANDKHAALAELRVELDEASETHLQLLVHGGLAKLQIVVPSTYSSGASADSGEVFLVLTMGDVTGKVESAMINLNERLEKISVAENALRAVLDQLLAALKRINLAKRRREETEDELIRESKRVRLDDDESEEEYQSDDENDVNSSCYDIAMGETRTICEAELENRTCGRLHAMAEEARRICEDSQRDARDDLENLFMWLRVASKPMLLTVQVQLEIAGMIDERVAAGLGLTLQEPVALRLEFSKNAWSESSFRGEELPQYERVSASQSSSSSNSIIVKDLDDIDRFLEASGGDGQRSYGLDVLFPELTEKFFQNLGQESGKGLHTNPFVRLALFIALQLRLLPGWCLVCHNKLPFSVTRMRTCENNFCLYRFEELGLGVSVLDEVRSNPALVDLELSLACCAVESSRDVFEPFPGFLLKKHEIRGRSGWFSSSSSLPARKSNLSRTNKRFELLKHVLSSIPAIKTLAGATSERALKRALTRAWYLRKYEGSELAPHGGPVAGRSAALCAPEPDEPWLEEANLAYDVTRFVLMTNRLSLLLLTPANQVLKSGMSTEKDVTLPVAHLTHYQFVILHDTPEKEAYFTAQRDLHGSFFAFHGSPAENWYSILRNGLRSMSKTSFMSSGAAYGEGIYLATELATSVGYARSTAASWLKGELQNGFQCVAICEVINGSPRANGSNILVVPREHERNVAIRYLLVLKQKAAFHGHGICVQGRVLSPDSTDLLAHYLHLQDSHAAAQKAQRERLMSERSAIFLAHRATESIKNSPPSPSSKKIKKFAPHTTPSPNGNLAVMQEFRNLTRAIKKAPPLARLIERGEPASVLSGTTVAIPDESNLALWRISLDPYLLKSSANLYNDFKELQRLRKLPQMLPVELEVTFPAAFPFDPPFVRVLSPRFKMHSGHVTVGGSICMELLTASGWSPACNFESLLVQVVMAFVEGDGRLDFKSSREYQECEAREAFLRAARAHGWKTT